MNLQTQALQPFDFLKLLAHELRWQLVTALTRSDYRVQELIDILQQPQNLVSYHLKQLRDWRLVVERRSTADARDIYYSLDLVQLQSFYDAVGEALHPALPHRETAGAEGIRSESARRIRILLLCTENSARSQMAEGILRQLSDSHFEVFSAGTVPTTVHPSAVQVLRAMGIDISQQRAKSIDEFEGQPFDYIITVCDRARENCPVFPDDSRFIHWSLSDPVAVVDEKARYQAFEQTAQQLMTRIRYFLVQISHEKEKAQ
jgi:protein-tyrosine-phosphatase/DNA-binding transcriptional ArsR family regulator